MLYYGPLGIFGCRAEEVENTAQKGVGFEGLASP